jgi:hypothetical protein
MIRESLFSDLIKIGRSRPTRRSEEVTFDTTRAIINLIFSGIRER